MESRPAIAEGPDPLHGRSGPNWMWTTTNIGEAMPGVLTPLGYTVWSEIAERATRRCFHALGVVSSGSVGVPSQAADRLIGVFYGRPAFRVEFFCRMGDRLPGTSGAAVAKTIFGSVPPGLVSRKTRRYYPAVAVRLPVAWMTAPKRVRRARAVTENWWQRELRCIAVADREEACTRFTAALVRFEENVVLQGIVSFALVQPLMDQLTRVVASAGETGPRVMAGYGGHEESQMVRDLWNVSRGRLDLDAFLARHGYHGPREGEISGVVWREDPSPVLEILEGYRGLGEEADPTKASALRATERQRAERKVLAALPASQRIWGRTILALSRRYAPLRGVGKTAFLQSLDIARAAARRLGTCLAAEGVLDDPADIFFLTKGEVCQAQWAEARGQVEVRRERYRTYENVELPVAWRGMPFPRAVEATVDEGTEGVLEGVAASPGMVEGRVRVMADHGESAVDPGDILVAHVTDPSWASALFLSSALVTDIGGLLSHAAVVARELGIPCVAGTRVATKVLRTGDRCRVNGTTGRVEVLERIAPDEAKRSE